MEFDFPGFLKSNEPDAFDVAIKLWNKQWKCWKVSSPVPMPNTLT